MTFNHKPTLKYVIFGHLNSRRLESTRGFERGLVFKCHIVCWFQALKAGALNADFILQHPHLGPGTAATAPGALS